MKQRFTAPLLAVLVLALAAFTGSALAGNGNGNGNGNNSGSSDKQSPTSASQPATGGDNSTGVKPSNTTKHDAYAKASSDKTKQYGNGKTAGQIATQAGYGDATLHGPGNSQPHKTAPCPGGHEVDVHALKNKKSTCANSERSTEKSKSTPTSTEKSKSTPTAAPAQVQAQVQAQPQPAVAPTSVPTPTPATAQVARTVAPAPATPPVRVHPTRPVLRVSAAPAGGVKGAVVALQAPKAKPAGGVLGATTRLRGTLASTRLPFTGLPLWIYALAAAGLIGIGLTVRRASANRI